MSDTQLSPEDANIQAATKDFQDYSKSFEVKYGYSIGAVAKIQTGEDGVLRLTNTLQLIPKPQETPVPTTPNGNSTAKETSAGDSSKQPKG